MNFGEFFEAATGHEPYAYQCRLAGGGTGRPCNSQLLSIPTGLGKTAAVVLAWLWNRADLHTLNAQPPTPNRPWPRRLVYCLPMRTLVEQTRDNVADWLTKLVKAYPGNSELEWLAIHSPVILMGGEEPDGEWDIHPERPAILIGTQDMLLSRALNRGYAAGRARWPKDFALLNNDCLWVLDEVQLMSTGFATSLQLQAWRENMHPASPVHSWWMSATVEKEWLETSIDFREHVEDLWEDTQDESRKVWDDDSRGDAHAAHTLKSMLQPKTKVFDPTAAAELKGKDDARVAEYMGKVATKVAKKIMKDPKAHVLVILNTVARASRLAAGLEKYKPLLLHSRFRHRERMTWQKRLKSERLTIATQVVEAGVDISAKTLFAELCPWPSFVQRCGRAARYPGEMAEVFWLDVSKAPLPYAGSELEATKEQLPNLTDVSLAGFRSRRDGLTPDQLLRLLPYDPRFVPQSKDLLELFDTTPDLTGADIDISRYIRDGDEHDITVFWRDCGRIKPRKNPPKAKSWQPEHAELCPVPVGEFGDFAKQTNGRIWRWDYRDGWTRLNAGDAERIYPGQVFLLDKSCGGYDPDRGWTGNPEDKDLEVGPWKQSAPNEADDTAPDEDPQGSENNIEGSDGGSNTGQKGQWRSILSHSREVCEELAKLLKESSSPAGCNDALVLALAARLHDWGKAHAAFLAKVKREELAKAAQEVPDGLPAKAPDHCWRRDKPGRQPAKTTDADYDHRRPGFRHELASALAILELLRLHQPDHVSLAWPDAELRAGFSEPEAPSPPPLPESALPLAREIAALTPEQFNLLLYLVAAHHGKVRLSLRSSPDDQREDVPQPCPPDKRQARGVREDDALPAVSLPAANFEGAEVHAPQLKLHLDVMDLGLSHPYGPSWRERTQALLETHGPFRLGWYEMLLRTADARASAKAETPAKPQGGPGVLAAMELREEAPAYGTAGVLSPADKSLVADLVADGLSIQDKFRPEPLYKQTGKGHYESDTVQEIRRGKEQPQAKQKR